MNPIPNAPSVERVRRAVLAMPMAQTLALAFDTIGAGTSTLRAPVQPGWCFAPGQLQATAMFALADFAAVSAAGTLLPEGWANSTVDASVKFVAPARGTPTSPAAAAGAAGQDPRRLRRRRVRGGRRGARAALRHLAGHGAQLCAGGVGGAVCASRRPRQRRAPFAGLAMALSAAPVALV